MATAKLPNKPKNHEFEEYTAAFMQASGYHLERNITQQEDEQVLELDIIAADYSGGGPPRERLLEIKSGQWGFSDVFKLRGWAEYLHMPETDLVVCTTKPNQEFYEKKCEEIGVGLYYHPNEPANLDASKLYSSPNADPIDIGVWRFSYWLERELLRVLTHKRKCLQDRSGYRAVERYFRTLTSGIFFESNVIKRADKLYDAYKDHPHISAKLGHELAGDDFDEDHGQIPDQVFRDTFYYGKFTDIHISTYVEYRARLALLKVAVDFALYEDHGFHEKVKHEIEILGWKLSLKDLLPESFLSGLKELRTHTEFHLYPIFWQQFLWLFGGFILEDYREHEYQLLSMKTGVSLDQVENALSAFDLLFPNTWFNPASHTSNIRFLRMFSTPFMGIGANYRRLQYTESEQYSDLSLTGLHTCDDLIKWNDLVVNVLTGE